MMAIRSNPHGRRGRAREWTWWALAGCASLSLAAAGALLVLGGALRRRGKRAGDDERWVPSSRRARTAQLARLGSRVGKVHVSASARRVFASAAERREIDRATELRTAAEVVETLGAMKGVMMKFGQMASYLDEGMPETYRSALGQLQRDAPPMSPELAASVVSAELGGPPEEVFALWDPVPVAAASIGQVHRAITRDGRPVAVKVQYPGVAEAMSADLENTDLLARSLTLLFPSLDPRSLLSELRVRLSEELDYGVEAANQEVFSRYFAGHPFIHVPDVYHELSSKRVLTMELAEGSRLDEVESWPKEERDLAGEAIFRFVFRSLYRLGAFNGDPHPGNYLFQPHGHVTFLDFGLVKRFERSEMTVFDDMIRTLLLHPDPEAFRNLMETVGLLSAGAPIPTDDVVRFFGDFYALVLEKGRREVTPDFSSRMVRHVFAATDPVTKYTNVPPMFVVVQRINLGLYGVLARLNAGADWRSVAEELWPSVDGPASSALGEKEAAWLAAGGGKAA